MGPLLALALALIGRRNRQSPATADGTKKKKPGQQKSTNSSHLIKLAFAVRYLAAKPYKSLCFAKYEWPGKPRLYLNASTRSVENVKTYLVSALPEAGKARKRDAEQPLISLATSNERQNVTTNQRDTNLNRTQPPPRQRHKGTAPGRPPPSHWPP